MVFQIKETEQLCETQNPFKARIEVEDQLWKLGWEGKTSIESEELKIMKKWHTPLQEPYPGNREEGEKNIKLIIPNALVPQLIDSQTQTNYRDTNNIAHHH